MNPKYAVFIWGSYGIAFAVLLWNVLVPTLRRGDLKRRGLSADDAGEAEE
jgi:heme exporter protein CcmD